MSNPVSEESLLQFPCEFPIKVMGKNAEGFAQTIADIVIAHAPDFDPATVEMRASKENRYLSLTVTVRATSKAQLDALYLALTAHPMVSMVL
jgi:putative lipoic acid-binding regulatory protein